MSPGIEFNSEGDLPGTLSLRVFGSPVALAQAVSGRVQEAVMTGVRSRGQSSLLLDAGPVLRRGYEWLSTVGLPWASVRISLSPAATASQEPSLRATLLKAEAAGANLTAGPPPGAAGVDATAEHDLVLLAMAADGSIAALAGDAETPPPLGRAALLNSRRIVVVAQGLVARDAFERQALSPDAGRSELLTLVQEATQPIEFCWCR